MKHHKASQKQSTTLNHDIGEGVSRNEMISVAAYYRAEHRGFGADDSLADWFSAEAIIDATLKSNKDIKVH